MLESICFCQQFSHCNICHQIMVFPKYRRVYIIIQTNSNFFYWGFYRFTFLFLCTISFLNIILRISKWFSMVGSWNLVTQLFSCIYLFRKYISAILPWSCQITFPTFSSIHLIFLCKYNYTFIFRLFNMEKMLSYFKSRPIVSGVKCRYTLES